MDRIDIHINVPRLSTDEIKNGKKSESSKEIRDRVNRCRAVQKRRYQGIKAKCNGELNPKEIELYCVCERDASDLLYKSMEKMHMTARAYSKILKLARTIADLEESPTILKEHIAEAISYRMLDRNYI